MYYKTQNKIQTLGKLLPKLMFMGRHGVERYWRLHAVSISFSIAACGDTLFALCNSCKAKLPESWEGETGKDLWGQLAGYGEVLQKIPLVLKEGS